MDPKKLPNLHMNQSMFSITYTKSFEVKPQFDRYFDSNLTESFSTLRFFFRDTLVCKHRTWQIVRNLLNFLPWPPHMISWDIDKSHDFQTLFAFLGFKNHSATRSWSCFLNKMFKISFHSPGKASHKTQ